MEKTKHSFAVLFSDIAGSTHIYEQFGDAKASSIINNALALMTDIVTSHAGTLIKTIGDEVMCRFYNIDNAVEAACEINEKLLHSPPTREIPLAARTGIHWGPALLQDDGDLLGDVVNVAARMTSIAQAKQIITTEEVVSRLSPPLKQKCREFDRAEVKGKSAVMIIYEVVWEPQDLTRIASPPSLTLDTKTITPLEIRYQNQNKVISKESRAALMGRGKQCDIVIQSPLASRNHATIKISRDKFILIDQSTNGTYVRFNSGKQFYLRRETLPLSESGAISLGEKFSNDNTHLIFFKV
ncbi:MAG: FHA domain-containing protein [Pseudomonadales bacterium]|nr:FHA domain-containing protein [Pseudomonadales bacterium]